MITIIAAIDSRNGIGKNGTLAWHVPEDMSHFLRTTKGGTVVMGRKTFEGLRSPLKGRENWVLSQSMQPIEGVRIVRTVQQVLGLSAHLEIENLFIIGGAEIYCQFEPLADRMIITRIDGYYDCDTFFPDFDSSKFNLVEVEVLSVNAKVYYYERKT